MSEQAQAAAPSAGACAGKVDAVGVEAANLLAGLHEACFSGQEGGETWDSQAFLRLLALPGAFAGVLRRESPAAFVLARSLAGEAEILALGVLPALRRQGLGRRILAWTLNRAAAMDAQAVFLEVSEANPGAAALYRAAGFREVGRRKAYYRDGRAALVLRCDMDGHCGGRSS